MRFAWMMSAVLATFAGVAGAQSDSRIVDEPRWFKQTFLDMREDVGDAARSGRRLMLYFHQDGCPYCAKLLRDNFGRKDVVERMRRHFDVVSINIWGDREVTDLSGTATTEKAFARGLRVQFTPTLLVFDERGAVAQRINGYLPPPQFIAALERAAPASSIDARTGAGIGGPQPSAALRAAGPAASGDRVSESIRSDATDPPPALSSIRGDRRLAARLARDPRPMLVVFDEPRCPTCSEMRNDGFARSEVRRALNAFHVVRVDRTSPDRLQTPTGEIASARDWARALNVQYAPTLAFFDRSGREVFRIDAYLRPFHVAAALDYVGSGAYVSQPEFQRYIEARAAERRGRGEKVELMR